MCYNLAFISNNLTFWTPNVWIYALFQIGSETLQGEGGVGVTCWPPSNTTMFSYEDKTSKATWSDVYQPLSTEE